MRRANARTREHSKYVRANNTPERVCYTYAHGRPPPPLYMARCCCWLPVYARASVWQFRGPGRRMLACMHVRTEHTLLFRTKLLHP